MVREIISFITDCFVRGLYIFIIGFIPVWITCEIRDSFKKWKDRKNERNK